MKNTRSSSWFVAVLISIFAFSEAAFSEQDLMVSSSEVEIRIEGITYTSTKYRPIPEGEKRTVSQLINEQLTGDNFFIDVLVRSNLNTAYLNFFTHRISCNEQTGDCARFPSGYAIRDSYGNNLVVSGIEPMHGPGSAPLRPGEEKKFRIWTKSAPLDGIKYLTFEVPRLGFGNKEELKIRIPASAISKKLIGDGHT